MYVYMYVCMYVTRHPEPVVEGIHRTSSSYSTEPSHKDGFYTIVVVRKYV